MISNDVSAEIYQTYRTISCMRVTVTAWHDSSLFPRAHCQSHDGNVIHARMRAMAAARSRAPPTGRVLSLAGAFS